MAGRAISGKYFQANEQVTASKLHQIIESALFSNFSQSDLAANAGVVVIGSTAPSDTDAMWWDTTLSLLRVYDGTDWQPVGRGYVLTNASGATRAAGDVVIASGGTNRAFTTTTTASDPRWIGIVAESIADGAKGVILNRGRVTVTLASASAGRASLVSTSTTAGKAVTGATSGVFGITTTGSVGTSVPVFLRGQVAIP